MAESGETIVVEGNHYFPPAAVRTDCLTPSGKRTICTWKGFATYYDLGVGTENVHDAAWTYRRPFPWIRKIRGYIAFSDAIEVAE
ncbi:MAG: DUF427 domain-containing protein [Actinomycetota bacterium]|nr:DUF427 domain-containing protein [Actinomycetota bacterium]